MSIKSQLDQILKLYKIRNKRILNCQFIMASVLPSNLIPDFKKMFEFYTL